MSPVPSSRMPALRGPFRTGLIIVTLVGSTLLAFWPVRANQFVDYDDQLYVTQNDHVKAGLTWDGFAWAFQVGYAGNWHPLTWMSHMLDCQLFDLDAAAHHTVSVLFHAANAGLIFWLLRRMTGAVWRSALVAALFALHPLRVESVAWASERKDVLSAFFGLLAMLAYVRYASSSSVRWYGVVATCFALSLMAKPMLVTLPFVLLLLDYWPLRRIGRAEFDEAGSSHEWKRAGFAKLCLEKLPLLAMSFGSSVLTQMAQRASHTVADWNVLPLSARLGNAVTSYVLYLNKAAYPTGLVVLYPLAGARPAWHVAAAATVLAIVTAATFAARRRHPYLIVGWLWYLGTLIPTIGLVQVGLQAMADRYTYVPMIGVAILVVFGVAAIPAARRFRAAAAALAAAVLIALTVSTRAQVRVWHDSTSLFSHALRFTRNNWAMHTYLASVLIDEGKASEARVHLTESLRIRPNDPVAWYHLADAQVRLGSIREAIDSYKKVVSLEPDAPDVLNDLAWFLATHPDSAVRDGSLALALATRACELTDYRDPRNLDTLAAAYAETGRYDDAVRTANRALGVARAAGEAAQAKGIERALVRYRAGQPLREKPQ